MIFRVYGEGCAEDRLSLCGSGHRATRRLSNDEMIEAQSLSSKERQIESDFQIWSNGLGTLQAIDAHRMLLDASRSNGESAVNFGVNQQLR